MVNDVTILKGDLWEVRNLVARQPAWYWTVFPIRGASLAIGYSNSGRPWTIEGPTPGSAGLGIKVSGESVEINRGPFAWVPIWWSSGRLTWITTAPDTLASIPAIPCRFREQSWQTKPRLVDGVSDFSRGVFRLPPSTKLIIDPTGLSFSSIRSEPRNLFEPDQFEVASKELLDTFMNSLEKMPHDAAIALSGGLDSSAILAGLVALGRRPRTFTMKSKHPVSDETEWVNRLTQYFGLPPAEAFDIDDFPPFVHGIPFVEGPQSQPTEPFEATFYLRASKGQPVLTGLGADQLFDASLKRRLLSAWKFNDYSAWVAEESTMSPLRLLRIMLTNAPDPTVQAFDSWAWDVAMRGLRRISRQLDHPLYAPFLCQPLLDCTERIPAHWCQRGASNKHILRYAVREILPRDVWDRPKQTHFGPVATESVRRFQSIPVATESLDPNPSLMVPSGWRGIALARWKEK